jgi:polar amino acid transport system substrate-binding protein
MLKKFVFLAAMTLAAPLSALADDIVLEADSWCPFNCEPGSDRPGFMVEIAQKVLGAQGHKIVYQIRPWARAIDNAKKGTTNGVIGASKADAPELVFPENELSNYPMDSFFVKAESNWTFTGVDSLSSVTLGSMLDYGYNDELLAYIKANPAKVDAIGGDAPLESNIKKLMAGRVDVVVEAPPVFWDTVTRLGLKDKVKAAGAFPTQQAMYIAFSPANPKSAEYAKSLSDGVATLRASGELKAILEKYGLQDWK